MNWVLIILSFNVGWFGGITGEPPREQNIGIYESQDMCRVAAEKLEQTLPTSQKVVCTEENKPEAIQLRTGHISHGRVVIDGFMGE